MLRRLYDMLFPRACAICGQRLALGEQALCAVCNVNLPRTRFTEDPEDNAMVKTISSQMAVERATALYRHLSHSSSGALIYNLKYGGHPEYGDMMGELMAKEILPTGFFEGIDLLVPIPLTRDRRRQRGVQSERVHCRRSEPHHGNTHWKEDCEAHHLPRKSDRQGCTGTPGERGRGVQTAKPRSSTWPTRAAH